VNGAAPTSWAVAERVIVRRARHRVAVVVAFSVSALLALVGGIAYSMLVRGQEGQIHRDLAYNAGRVDTPLFSGCMWIFVFDRATLSSAPSNAAAPVGFPESDVLRAVALDGLTRLSTVARDGTLYYVRTQPRGSVTVQAVFDARYQLSDRRHLLFALVLAEVIGLVAAGCLGLLVGRHTVAPLAEALVRQRTFVADASHELRTPIAQLHTHAQVLLRRARHGRTAGPEELERLVGTTRLLGEIVDDLLLSARLSATPVDRLPTEWIDLRAIAEAAVAAEADRSAERGITVTLDRPDTPLTVPGVASALRRVVGELLANALTHTPTGGRIDVTLRRDGRSLADLVVTNTGQGFDPADAERIFERFYRGQPTDDRQFGLGLALVREVVTSHGGTIEATGLPGRGACFRVRLPTPPQVPSAPDGVRTGTAG
jgi:signal transduction histidine kinase